ncbi:MAG TPA: SDR family oxidoreductase [Gemmatimonadaceae bacterium]|nr:SDR family oxidoreductase [Gemmatimonadaceae bacterium]
MSAPPRVLVLGAAGMLGHAVFRVLARNPGLVVAGTVRGHGSVALLPDELRHRLITGVDVEHIDSLIQALATSRPDVVVNCVGLVKQLSSAEDPLVALPINALLPHRLSNLCAVSGTRLIHISTDCVFSGSKGMYVESDPSDAKDLYGRSKYLGEVDAPHAITLRTSIIGHELGSARGLLEWFLAQDAGVKGYRRAIFSGLPTVELARVIGEYVLPRPQLNGVYHVAAAPIAKFDLLTLFARAYGKAIPIVPDDALQIDRSLDGRRFREATGYVAPAWPDLVQRMQESQ